MGKPTIAVSIEADAPLLRKKAQSHAAMLDLPFIEDSFADLMLMVTRKHLELLQLRPTKMGPIFVDFAGDKMVRRVRAGGLSKQLLARAIGFKGNPLTVRDATAGMGRDAFLLANIGCVVTAYERSPIIAALLRDGLERAAVDPVVGPIVRERFMLIEGDARAAMTTTGVTPDVTYIDPMFPSRAKTALSKKEMRICRLVTGDDTDAHELLEGALSSTRCRVVVKRWLHAPPLGRRPDNVYKGKTIRYDVYRPHK